MVHYLSFALLSVVILLGGSFLLGKILEWNYATPNHQSSPFVQKLMRIIDPFIAFIFCTFALVSIFYVFITGLILPRL